ncbi:MAG: DUF4340 domain-containing protein, partial [Candidatus Latescibacteria bacterium]|nr:DUF4340 domain-containing protein [Candidatus Latescibacterota bacterium]
MKNKTPLIMGGIFLLLVVIFFVTTMNPRERSKGAEPLFAGDKPDITRLEFESVKNGRLVIEERNGVWSISEPIEYKASEEAVQQTLTALKNVLIDGVISRRVEVRDKYDVSDSLGTHLKAFAADKLVLDVIVGKNTVDLNHTYARLADSDDITLWRGLLTSHVNRSVDDWRDKTVYSFNPDDILEIRSVTADTTKVLALQDTLWVYTENGTEKPIDQKSAGDLVSLIASLRCDAFADENDIPRVAENEADTGVSFKVRNGDVHSFDVWSPGEKDSGRYLIRKKDGSEVFRFYRYRGSQLVIDYDRLK